MPRTGRSGGNQGLLLAVLGGVLLLLFFPRKAAARNIKAAVAATATGAEGIRVAFDAAKRTVFAQLIGPCGKYATDILVVAAQYGIDPFLFAAILRHESGCGTAKGYRLQGDPAGSGDFIPRTRAAIPKNVPDSVLRAVGSNTNGVAAYLPADGLGWGRGIAQVDFAQHYDFVKTGGWKEPRAALNYVADRVLSPAAALFSKRPPSGGTINVPATAAAVRRGFAAAGAYADPRPLKGAAFNKALAVAYNAGPLNALWAVAAGVDPDKISFSGDYGSKRLAEASALTATFERTA